jgi:RNA polymerase sigma factor (sigma-70 family)
LPWDFLGEVINFPLARYWGSMLEVMVASETCRRAAPSQDPLRALARATLEGSPHSAEKLLLELTPPLLRTLRMVMGPHHPDLDDLLQDSIMGFLRALPGFRWECSVAHFARRLAVQRALEARRRSLSTRRTVERASMVPQEEAGRPDDSAMALRLREQLRLLLDELPAPQAEALILRFSLGHTSEEIAELTGIPANTVRSRLRLGIVALRRRIDTDARCRELAEARR